MSTVRVVGPSDQALREWRFRLGGELASWDGSVGAPDPLTIEPVRRVRSGAMSRHVPVQAYSATRGSTLALESGLEFELFLWLDRQPECSWLVAQPCILVWDDGRRHTPDLLSVDNAGAVTLWDARSSERRSEDFDLIVERTLRACADVGWHHEVFEGLPRVSSLNLRWLAGARRPPEWLEPSRRRLREVVGDAAVIGDVVAADDARGHLKSVMWHLLWTGELRIDLEVPWDAFTPLSWTKAA